MQTIPNAVLDKMIEHRPHLTQMVTNLRNHPDRAPQFEQAIAVAYLVGETHLSAQETWYLSQVAHGGPWGGDWVRSTHAAVMLGVDESRIRQRIASGELPSLLYGKTRYVRRDAL